MDIFIKIRFTKAVFDITLASLVDKNNSSDRAATTCN